MFYALKVPETTCAGPFNTDTGYQPEPTLFRTTFQWPADRPLSATLKFRSLIDDGAVFYLNGQEVFRDNAPASPILAGTRALAATAGSTCSANISVTVSNLVQGDNVFAVALLQAATTGSDEQMFGLTVDSVHLATPPLPSEPEPRLDITHGLGNDAEVSWLAGGYALESAGDLSGAVQSYPLGSWIEVTNVTNPYRLSLTNDEVRFFRLKRK
jgi:hypothetical protein